MATKPYRKVISYATPGRYISDVELEAGYGVIIATNQPTASATGQALNEKAIKVGVPTGQNMTNMKFVGIVLHDVVELDQAVYTRSALKPMTQIVGEPLPIMEFGEIETNAITGNPTAEAVAYLQDDGTFGPIQADSLPAVGKFKTVKDSDGYAVVAISVY